MNIQNFEIDIDYDRTEIDKQYLLKLRIFECFKNYIKYKKYKKKDKEFLLKKESKAKIFYNNLLKSRVFFGLIKNLRNKRFYYIINDSYKTYININYK